MREMAREEAERLYSERMQVSISKAAEDALSGNFQTGFELLKGGLKNKSYIFMEHGLTEMTHNEALDNLFDRTIE